MTLVAVHQPNFLPWLGFFDKLVRADRFVILDSVPLQLTGGNYTNRVRMIVNGAPAWITMPLRRGYLARSRIDLADVVDEPTWRRKARSTIAQSYARAPFFELAMPIVDSILEMQTASLFEINMAGIVAVATALKLPVDKIVRSSELNVDGHSNELLANLVQAVGGNSYLAGLGAGDYQDDRVFAERNITVCYQNYLQPSYPQIGVSEFVPGMSAIDALMNCGHAASKLVGIHTGQPS